MRRRLVGVLAASLLVACGGGPDGDGHGGPAAGDDTVQARESATEEGSGTTPGSGTTDVASVDCAGTADATHPDVVAAELEEARDGTWTVAATLCSAYDSTDRYADAFRVVVPATDEVLGVRELTHPHAEEQPFTRSLMGVTIPEGVTAVVIEGRDLANGWGGATVRVEVPAGG